MRVRLALVALLATAGAASAQRTAILPTTCRPDGTLCVQATPVVNPDGTSITAGGGGGGGDASAANQTLQLTQEQLTAARLGDTASPAAGSVNARLLALLTALGSPVQAGATLPVSLASQPLPTGAASAARQDTMISALGSPFQAGGTIAGITNPVGVTGTFFQATQPVSLTSQPLPAGASTATNQSTMIGSLGTIATNTTGASTLAAQTTGNNYLATLAAGSGQPSAPFVWSTSGAIAALNGTVELVAPGSGSALLTVTSSNFVGTLTAYGCADAACTVLGGRLLFKSGVGSIGTNSITLTGGTMAREYRIVAGGNRIRIVATAYTSGTVNVAMLAQPNSNILFVNGPVHTGEEEALRAGRAYIVSSQVQAVAANSNLIATISNPAGSGVNTFVTMRLFECNQATATTPAEWITYVGPTTVPTTVVTPSNRMIGGATPQTQFRFQVTTSATMGGTQADGGTLVTGGGPTPNMIMTTLVPGQTGGVLIGGGGGGLAAAQRCKVSYAFYEESQN